MQGRKYCCKWVIWSNVPRLACIIGLLLQNFDLVSSMMKDDLLTCLLAQQVKRIRIQKWRMCAWIAQKRTLSRGLDDGTVTWIFLSFVSSNSGNRRKARSEIGTRDNCNTTSFGVFRIFPVFRHKLPIVVMIPCDKVELLVTFQIAPYHTVREARLGSQVRSKGNLWDAVDHYPSYFQVISIIFHSCNIQAQFCNIKYYSVRMGLRHSLKICRLVSDWFRGISNWLGVEKTTFASVQIVEGSNSYNKLKTLKVSGGCCNLDK